MREECEFKIGHAADSHYSKCFYIGNTKDGEWMCFHDCIVDNIKMHNIKNGVYLFRPLKTERDLLVERAIKDIVGDSKVEHVSLKASEQIEKLVNAGWRPTND